MQQLLFSFLLLSFWWPHAFGADTVYPEHPKDIRLTGTLLAPTEQAHEDIVTINIFLGDAPRLLRIGKIEDLTQDEKDRAVKEGILMRQVRFYGPDEVMKRLQQPDIVGKALTIEGRLDVQERRFLVKSVTENPGEGIAPPMPK
jgi:hypothetical protein